MTTVWKIALHYKFENSIFILEWKFQNVIFISFCMHLNFLMSPWKFFMSYAQMKFVYDCEDLVMLNLELQM